MHDKLNETALDRAREAFWSSDNETDDIALTEAIRAYLEAAPQPPAGDGWQDISTAPEDGPDLIIIGSYNHRREWVADVWAPKSLADQRAKVASTTASGPFDLEWMPTHWSRLPAPPKWQRAVTPAEARRAFLEVGTRPLPAPPEGGA